MARGYQKMINTCACEDIGCARFRFVSCIPFDEICVYRNQYIAEEAFD